MPNSPKKSMTTDKDVVGPLPPGPTLEEGLREHAEKVRKIMDISKPKKGVR